MLTSNSYDEKFEVLYSLKVADKVRDKRYFVTLLNALNRSPAFSDRHSRICIDENNAQIHFGCSLKEIQASFPEFTRMVMGGKRLTDDNIRNFGFLAYFTSHIPTNESHLLLRAAESSLLTSDLLSEETKKPSVDIPKEFQLPDELLVHLLRHHHGIILGEVHTDRAPKQLLIDTMPLLAREGLTRIYLEHLLSDTQSSMLEYYFADKKNQMPVMLRDYLVSLDDTFKNPSSSSPPGFLDLVTKAKACNIRVVPIDTRLSYALHEGGVGSTEQSIKSRSLALHYQTQRIFANDLAKSGKYLVFCGSLHVNSMQITEKNGRVEPVWIGVPGIAKLAGRKTVSMVVQSAGAYENAAKQTADTHPVQADVLIVIDPTNKNHSMTARASHTTPAMQKKNPATFFQPQTPPLPAQTPSFTPTQTSTKGKSSLKK